MGEDLERALGAQTVEALAKRMVMWPPSWRELSGRRGKLDIDPLDARVARPLAEQVEHSLDVRLGPSSMASTVPSA